MSFENSVKALLLASGELFADSDGFDRKLLTHKMSAAISKVDSTIFKPTEAEIEILKKLEEYVIWRGRYPSPLFSVSDFSYSILIAEYRQMTQFWDRIRESLTLHLQSQQQAGA